MGESLTQPRTAYNMLTFTSIMNSVKVNNPGKTCASSRGNTGGIAF